MQEHINGVKIIMNLVFQEVSTLSYTVWLKTDSNRKTPFEFKGD